MKKKVFGTKLSRDRGSRGALMRSLLRALIINGKITTTHAKADFVRIEAEKLIKQARKNGFNDKRKIMAFLANNRQLTELLYKNVPAFAGITSGFTKLTKLPARKGDNAKMVRLEWSRKSSISKESKSKKEENKTSATKIQTDKKSLRGRLSSLSKRSAKSVKKSV